MTTNKLDDVNFQQPRGNAVPADETIAGDSALLRPALVKFELYRIYGIKFNQEPSKQHLILPNFYNCKLLYEEGNFDTKPGEPLARVELLGCTINLTDLKQREYVVACKFGDFALFEKRDHLRMNLKYKYQQYPYRESGVSKEIYNQTLTRYSGAYKVDHNRVYQQMIGYFNVSLAYQRIETCYSNYLFGLEYKNLVQEVTRVNEYCQPTQTEIKRLIKSFQPKPPSLETREWYLEYISEHIVCYIFFLAIVHINQYNRVLSHFIYLLISPLINSTITYNCDIFTPWLQEWGLFEYQRSGILKRTLYTYTMGFICNVSWMLILALLIAFMLYDSYLSDRDKLIRFIFSAIFLYIIYKLYKYLTKQKEVDNLQPQDPRDDSDLMRLMLQHQRRVSRRMLRHHQPQSQPQPVHRAIGLNPQDINQNLNQPLNYSSDSRTDSSESDDDESSDLPMQSNSSRHPRLPFILKPKKPPRKRILKVTNPFDLPEEKEPFNINTILSNIDEIKESISANTVNIILKTDETRPVSCIKTEKLGGIIQLYHPKINLRKVTIRTTLRILNPRLSISDNSIVDGDIISVEGKLNGGKPPIVRRLDDKRRWIYEDFFSYRNGTSTCDLTEEKEIEETKNDSSTSDRITPDSSTSDQQVLRNRTQTFGSSTSDQQVPIIINGSVIQIFNTYKCLRFYPTPYVLYDFPLIIPNVFMNDRPINLHRGHFIKIPMTASMNHVKMRKNGSVRLIKRATIKNNNRSISQIFPMIESEWIIHAQTTQNVIQSIKQRQLLDNGLKVDQEVWSLFQYVTEYIFVNSFLPKTFEDLSMIDWLESRKHFKPAKKRDYITAIEETAGNLEGMLKTRKLLIKRGFIKSELMNAPPNKPARMIMARDRKVQAIIAPLVSKMTMALKDAWLCKRYNEEVINRCYQDTFIYTSGLNRNEIGEIMTNILVQGVEYRFIGCDYSKFDASQHKGLVAMEMLYYDRLLSSTTDKNIMRSHVKYGYGYWKCIARNWVDGGVVYAKIEATRSTGDPQTTLANTLHNANFIFFAIFFTHGITALQGYKAFVCGDDSLVCEPKYQKQSNFYEILGRLGIKAKVETSNFVSSIEFCSSYFVRLYDQEFQRVMYYLHPKLGNLFSKSSLCVKTYTGPKLAAYAAQKAKNLMTEFHMHSDLVLYFSKLHNSYIQLAGDAKIDPVDIYLRYNCKTKSVQETYVDLARRYNCYPYQILGWFQAFRTLNWDQPFITHGVTSNIKRKDLAQLSSKEKRLFKKYLNSNVSGNVTLLNE